MIVIKLIRKTYYLLKNIKYHLKYLKYRVPEIEDNGILLFTNDFDRKGAPVLLLNIAKWLHSRNIPICIVSCKYGPLINEFKNYGPVVIRSPKKTEELIIEMNSRYEYKRAICNTVVTGYITPQLKQHGYYVVSMVHEMENAIKSLNLTKECEYIIKNSEKIVFPSNYTYRSFLKCLNKTSIENILIKNQGLYNIVKQKKSFDESLKSMERMLDIKLNEKFIVINVATASYRKGFDLFIDIAFKIRKSNPNIIFIWVGDNYRQILGKKLLEHKTSRFDNLFLPGYISDFNALNDIYNISDVLCLTSREEPFGSIVLEAFKSSTPVIAFDKCGGYMDVVRDNETGYLVPPFDIEKLVNKIVDISNHTELNKRIGQQCLEEVKKHNFDEYCEFLLSLFDK